MFRERDSAGSTPLGRDDTMLMFALGFVFAIVLNASIAWLILAMAAAEPSPLEPLEETILASLNHHMADVRKAYI
jgi:hypothetical protein